MIFYLLVHFNLLQMAQEVYDDSDDHFVQMKSPEDQAARQVFLEEFEKFGAIDTEDKVELDRMIQELRQKIEGINSPYVGSLKLKQ